MFRLIAMMTKWSLPFSQYWTSNVHPSISHLGAWELGHFKIDSVTTNQSESFNCVLKRLNDWKEAPVDAMVLSLFRLGQFYVAEVYRGYCGSGNYSLRLGVSPPNLQVTVSPVSPDAIVDAIRSGGESTTTSPSTRPPPSDSGSSGQVPSGPGASTSQSKRPSQLTQGERAWSVINAGHITLDAKLAVFTVLGTTEPRLVRLYPTATCSCPAKTECYHVRAAQVAIGNRVEIEPKKHLSLTQLCKSKRKRADKTSGRKKPRVDDVDVEPAGDADDNAVAALRRRIVASQPRSPTPPPTETIADVCGVCNASIPPTNKTKARLVTWVQCDSCDMWYHNVCVGLQSKIPDTYKCPSC